MRSNLYLLLTFLLRLTIRETLTTANSIDTGVMVNPLQRANPSATLDGDLKQYWGPLTPYTAGRASQLTTPHKYELNAPPGCTVTFVQALARHGARNPRAKELRKMYDLLNSIKDIVRKQTNSDWCLVNPQYQFLKDYALPSQPNSLTDPGKREISAMGQEFFERYGQLADGGHHKPFLRTVADGSRLEETADLFAQSFHDALTKRPNEKHDYTIDRLPDGDHVTGGANNPLRHSKCKAFEANIRGQGKKSQQAQFNKNILLPPIVKRMNQYLSGIDLDVEKDDKGTLLLMKMCPYEIARRGHELQKSICKIFENTDWWQYGYSETIYKWYRNGPGFPAELGPTQGVPWVKELMARVTCSLNWIEDDNTAVDVARDMNPDTFPLGKDGPLVVDFTHGSDMTSMLFALGVYPRDLRTIPLDGYHEEKETGNYSATWTVPFAARAYIEKMECANSEPGGNPAKRSNTEYVRVIVNDRVMNLTPDNKDPWGRETMVDFQAAAKWATDGGNWAACSKPLP